MKDIHINWPHLPPFPFVCSQTEKHSFAIQSCQLLTSADDAALQMSAYTELPVVHFCLHFAIPHHADVLYGCPLIQ